MHRMWNWKMIILKCLVITLGVFLAGAGLRQLSESCPWLQTL